jgi:hypothetical protein
MSNDTLTRKLRDLEIPKVDEHTKERHLSRASVAFQYAVQSTENEERARVSFKFFSWEVWGGVSAALCSLLVVISTFSTQPSTVLTSSSSRADLTVLNEMKGVFGGSLQAIVERGGVPSVVLSENGATSNSFPIALELQMGTEKIKVLSFSGEKIPVTLGKRTFEFEVFLSGDGKLVLITDGGSYHVDKETKVDEIIIQGRPLQET